MLLLARKINIVNATIGAEHFTIIGKRGKKANKMDNQNNQDNQDNQDKPEKMSDDELDIMLGLKEPPPQKKKLHLIGHSGYSKVEVIVRAYNSLTNKMNYGILGQDGEVHWMINDPDIGVGTTREAKIIFEKLKEIAII